eukprot:7381898-Prymnesium_polylepis.1
MIALNTTTVGSLDRAAFTACDDDRLPVDHQLPSQMDERRFSAHLEATGTARQSVRYDYLGTGVYELQLAVPTRGAFAVDLQLGDASVARLTGQAACSEDRAPLADGSCGCKAGSEPKSGTRDCQRCVQGYFKAFAGDDGCKECPAGSSQPYEGRSACVPCPIGEFQVEAGEAFCRRCSVGYF